MKKLAPLAVLFSSILCTSFSFDEFGERGVGLDSAARGEWWNKSYKGKDSWLEFLKVPREEVVAFALYTVDRGTLKLSAQLYPLYPDEPHEVRLEIKTDFEWQEVATAEVYERGWSAHFRIDDWDESVSAHYRVWHDDKSVFQGRIRPNPIDQDEIVVASMSCNSRWDRGDREVIVSNLRKLDPDLLFFAGDQIYDHEQHTAAWLLFGMQFRDVIKDRPTITITDDHDIGQGNFWGEGGKVANRKQGDDGGYYYTAEYVRMVQRCQTWHLPEPYDPTPIQQGIGVYYTNYNVGGVDFAIIEDRKFKSGPNGKIPQMGPRPDHINDPSYDRSSVDVEGLKLLGDRQLRFLRNWSEDWSGADMKCVLSQTNFAGAVHLHGKKENRLFADLDCNGWPQTGRNKALTEMRRGMAFHLAGDQHLAVVTRHGIENWGDGPVSFISPALVNTVYGRWWWPEDEKAGPNPVEGSPLPWTGDFEDGLGNKISMFAYANPQVERKRNVERDPSDDYGDGFGIARFNKKEQTVRFEAWPRYADVDKGDEAQFPGWPLHFSMSDNDGREAVAYLPTLKFEGIANPVVQVIEEATGEVLYTLRVKGTEYRPKVYSKGTYTVRVGEGRPTLQSIGGIKSVRKKSKKELKVVVP